ncbi:hypothetical protein HAX54_007887 [Datura stramonium]|uniref:SH3 domain-containing protein n=1 Tax=Datura stramonium TaxID=4076 RepID=A0ABS8TCB4_DATST|nr:hypothetical protein [Datura stramonium]
MMLDADKMVAAASSRNPTLSGALTRLQRCAFNGSWEVRIIAAQALTTVQFDLDELIKEMRNHDNAKKEWTDEELKKLYETHERLLDLVSLFCYVPRSKYLPLGPTSAKLIDVYRTRHNISASTGLSDPAVATGISDLMYETTNAKAAEPETVDDDLVNFWAASLGDDSLNNAPAINRVNEFLAGAGTDAPDVEEENIISRPSMSYDDMWAKTLLESSEMEEDDGRSSGSSSPDSVGSVETSISSHFGGMNYPSLFSSKPSTYGSSQSKGNSGGSRYNNNSYSGSLYDGLGSPIREEPPPYSSPIRERYESFENPLAGSGSHSFGSHEEERLNLTAGEELEIEYEVDGWFYVKKKRPGRDGKMAGLVPVLYVSQS